jgi:predicted methyltransferase
MTTASMLQWKECRRHARAMLASLAMAAILGLRQSPPARAWGTDSAEMADRIAALLNLKPGATIAEIGAGHGYMAARLAEKVGPTGSMPRSRS